MSSQLDALWAEFAAETEEHLDALERLLSDRRGANWTRDEIGALFRYFHSLKGTFLAMGFSNVEAVAHHCEDILSLVREGRTLLDGELATLLLRAVDCLKGMREDVIASQKDARPAADILRELEGHCGPQSTAASEPAAAIPADMPLSDDPEMLAIYSELLDQRLPSVALALSAKASARTGAAETAGELAYGAEMMGFDALAEQLQTIAEEATGAGDQTRQNLILHFGELREQVQIIEDITGVSSGAVSLGAALAAQLTPDYAASLDALAAAVSRIDEDAADAGCVVNAGGALRAAASCLGLERAARLLVLIEERFRNVDPLDPTVLLLFRDLAQDAIEVLRQTADATTDIEPNVADAIGRQWEASFRTPASLSLTEASASRWLRPDVLATLSAEQEARLETALADGRHAYQILLDLETHPDIAGDFIAWLSSAVETITSRTVYRDGANCFEFLIVSEHPADWINAQLAALDPEQSCLRGIEQGQAQAAIASPQVAASPATIRAPLIRVQSETIDELMAEVGEMRTALASLADLVQHGRIATALRDARRNSQDVAKHDQDARTHLDAMDGDLRDLKALEHTLEAAHRRIWSAGLQLRVIPVDGLFGRLSRAARDLAQKLGKNIDVVIEGREVRIDKSMVDLLIDPLMHMVRNAIDHGVETPEQRRAAAKSARATLSISASERGNSVDIVIADDGRGLDRSRILAKAISLGMIAPHQAEQMADREINALIFQPGFSTADAVTEISGRGVGMDVVAAALQRLGGVIDVESSLGAGTRFTLKLPVSAALLRALLVEVGTQIFALPERQVVSLMERARDEIDEVQGRQIIIYRGTAVPVHRLGAALGFDEVEAKPDLSKPDLTHIAIVTTGTRMFGLAVDRVLRFQDLFLKELHPMLAAVPVIAGASVLGDGRPVLVLDARGLVGLSPASDGVASPVAMKP
ncbi:chemotaxis protein CheA [Methyloferula stellata]|uniref:chemotaxis protein CheA n=1 Tax=Methyloferula stellata TaxID=876270 RepID=UPI00037314D1|nr:chemotaxis protein CheW [Methyloferula stellata]